MNILKIAVLVLITIIGTAVQAYADDNLNKVSYKTLKVDGQEIFYREAGDKDNPAIVALHGYGSSSHMYRTLLEDIGDEYYVLAPDYPGFGNSSFPSAEEYEYTFENLAKTMQKFVDRKGLKSYVLLIQDYGAPVGFHMAAKNSDKVSGFIVMNGNAYKEGLISSGWGPVFKYWEDKSLENANRIIRNAFNKDALKWQYTHGVRNKQHINPDNWNMANDWMSRDGQNDVQLSLLYDYKNNVEAYPLWQQYMRDTQPPMLIVWGKGDPYFSVKGAELYKNDVQNIDFNILDTGHFPLEEEAPFIIDKIREFMKTKIE